MLQVPGHTRGCRSGVESKSSSCFVSMRAEASPVEELAWLVKDNLYSKHLVLAVEEMFVEFLQPSTGRVEILELKPMESYQRMLLHRLADLFGLVHESVGEDEDRHLVVERCEDSKIPMLLVSDVLTRSCGYVPSDVHETKHLLKHDEPLSSRGQKRNLVVQQSAVPLEERQAAYLAARERIFAGKEDGGRERSPTPRPVPAVARRMIAHALGKPVRVGSESDAGVGEELEADGNAKGTDLAEASVTAQVEPVPAYLPKRAEHSPARAAKRLLTKALGFAILQPSHRSLSKQTAASDPATSGSSTLEFDSLKEAMPICSLAADKIGLKGIMPNASKESEQGVVVRKASSSSSAVTSEIRTMQDDRAALGRKRVPGQGLGIQPPNRSVQGGPEQFASKGGY